MQLKLSAALVEKYKGKSPEEICAILENHTEAPPASPAVEPPALPPMVSVPDFQALSAQVQTLTASIGTMTTRLDSVVSDASTAASKAIVQGLAGTGTPVPIGGGATDEAAKPAVKTFQENVQAGITAGLPKSKAVEAAIKADPAAYGEWLKTGGKNI